MDEIIKSITEAEACAREIKQQAGEEALKIAERAETEAAEIIRSCESECKILRETELNRAEKEGDESYLSALDKKRAEARAYADKILSSDKGTALEIVRRVTSGSC